MCSGFLVSVLKYFIGLMVLDWISMSEILDPDFYPDPIRRCCFQKQSAEFCLIPNTSNTGFYSNLNYLKIFY